MKISYLVDTDWIIDHFGRLKETKEKLKELQPEGIALSIIPLAELYEGIYYSKDPAKNQNILKRFLRRFPVLGINQEISQVFGRERGRLRAQGKVIADFDLLIASTCLHYHLTLLTNNVRHFERIEGLRIISLSS